jgi:hypothetical protein
MNFELNENMHIRIKMLNIIKVRNIYIKRISQKLQKIKKIIHIIIRKKQTHY